MQPPLAEPQVPAPPRPPGAAGPTAPPPAAPGSREPVAFPSQEPPSSRPYQPYAAEERTVVGLHIPGASSLYLILGLLQLAAAVVALIAPYWLTDRFFRGSPAHVVIFEELWRILAACLIAGACVCYALKVAADRRQLNDYAVQRLQLGFFWFALLAVVLHVVHLGLVKSLSWTGLLLGALVMAPTLLIPSVHLGLSGGFNVQPMMEGLSACLSNLFSPARFTAAVFLYALLTVLFTAAGLLYVIVPRVSMGWVFGTHGTNAAAFIWQWIGAALFFLFPAITYTCQERALVGRLATTIPKTLNVGLLVAALFHILELGSLLVDGGIKSRWLLPVLFAHWLLVLLASVIGLSASEPAPAFGYEYEPLPSERTGVVTSETPFGQPAAPVLIFYNGFQLRASFYTQLAEHAASWGVAVLQYDTGFGSTPTIAAEVALAPALAAWIAAAAVEPGGPYSGRLDPNRLAVGGHSRGGKLAALVLAGYPETFKAAYLVDPVDVTKYAPESAKNPSATRALAKCGLPVGITAAGIVSQCNPAESGYQSLWPAAGPGSWLSLLPQASHSRFADGGAIINVAADLLCGRGNDSREEVAELTATPLVAWLYQQLPPAGGSNSGISSSNDSAGTVAAASAAPAASAGAQGSPLAAQFWTWVAQQEVAGKMAFEVKAAPSNGALAPALEPALALAAGAW